MLSSYSNLIYFFRSGSDNVDFGIDQIDIKRSLLARVGNDLVIQLQFGSSGRGGPAETGSDVRDIELSVAVKTDNDYMQVSTI